HGIPETAPRECRQAEQRRDQEKHGRGLRDRCRRSVVSARAAEPLAAEVGAGATEAVLRTIVRDRIVVQRDGPVQRDGSSAQDRRGAIQRDGLGSENVPGKRRARPGCRELPTCQYTPVLAVPFSTLPTPLLAV